MDPIPHNFQVAQLRRHARHGLGRVLDVTVMPRAADRIRILFPGGFVSFLAGSQASREWPLADGPLQLFDDRGAGEP